MSRNALARPLVLLLPLALLSGCSPTVPTEPAQGPATPVISDYEQHSRRIYPRDTFPVLDDPHLVPASDLPQGFPRPRDPVIGIEADGEARAYPLSIMGRHELANDTLAGEPLVVTWCNLCQSAIVYRRRTSERVLTFGHEGVLYRRSFVMYDRQTDSLWVHATGECLVGPLAGQQLERYPAKVTYWSRWRDQYPDTRVLVGRPADGTMGTFRGFDPELGQDHGLVVYLGGRSKIYPFRDLPVVTHDEWQETPVVVVYSPPGGLAVAYRRRVGARVLTFADHSIGPPRQFKLQDEQTGTLWDALTGEAMEGELAGEVLQACPSHPMLVERYLGFHPEGGRYAPP